jgi:hypothetical protein
MAETSLQDFSESELSFIFAKFEFDEFQVLRLVCKRWQASCTRLACLRGLRLAGFPQGTVLFRKAFCKNINQLDLRACSMRCVAPVRCSGHQRLSSHYSLISDNC